MAPEVEEVGRGKRAVVDVVVGGKEEEENRFEIDVGDVG